MATSSSVTLDHGIGFDALIFELDRLVRAGVPPDRISVSHDAAVQWVCDAHWVYSDGPDAACAARRMDAQLALLRLMLAHGADPNKRKNRNSTPLAVCCRQFATHFQEHALEKLALVLAAGGNPRQTKDPALCMALGLREMRGEIFDMPFRGDAPPGHAEMVYQAVDMLLQAGADIEALDHRNMYSPLLMAAHMGSVPLLQLLGWGLDPAAVNARGRTPLRLAVSAGNLDVAAVLAEALAAQGKLVAADVRLFRGTEYESRVAALTTSVSPKKPAKPKAADGTAQRATWERAPALIDGPTDWQPSQYPDWLRTCLKEVIARLGSGADPRVPPGLLYLEYDGYFRSLRLSRTKSYISRSGAVEMGIHVFDWSVMRIRFSQVEGDDWVLREAIDLPMAPGAPPTTDVLCDAIGQLCARYFKTPA